MGAKEERIADNNIVIKDLCGLPTINRQVQVSKVAEPIKMDPEHWHNFLAYSLANVTFIVYHAEFFYFLYNPFQSFNCVQIFHELPVYCVFYDQIFPN